MRFTIPILLASLLFLVPQPGAAQNKDQEATANRIAQIQREIERLHKEMARLRNKEMARLRTDMLRTDLGELEPVARRKGDLENLEVRLQLAMLREELQKLQPVDPIKTGIRVSCTLEVRPVRGRMIPSYSPYGEGATVRIVAARDRKIVAEGKTDESSSVTLAVPPGKYFVEIIPRLASWPFASSGEVTVEEGQIAGLAMMIHSVVLK
jgi:hypothetical protein